MRDEMEGGWKSRFSGREHDGMSQTPGYLIDDDKPTMWDLAKRKKECSEEVPAGIDLLSRAQPEKMELDFVRSISGMLNLSSPECSTIFTKRQRKATFLSLARVLVADRKISANMTFQRISYLQAKSVSFAEVMLLSSVCVLKADEILWA